MSEHRGSNTPWHPLRVEKLKKLWAEKKSGAQIAEILGGGLSRSSVIAKANRLGLASRGEPANFRTCTAVVSASRKALRAPPVRPGPASPRGAKSRPPKQGPHLKPGAVFGPVATLDPVEAQKRSDAQAEAGKKLIDAFSAPANDDAILLIERRFGQCSWPVGEPDRPANQMCCGQPVPKEPAKGVDTYCAAHGLRAISRTRLGVAPDAKAYERSLRRVA